MRKPVFRGLFHLIAAILYTELFPLFYEIIPSDIFIPIILYLVGVITSFTCSALFHIIPWSKTNYNYMRKLDHIMNFVKIILTYYALIATIFKNINYLVIYTIIFGSILGIILRIGYTDAPKFVIATPYLMIGWAILLDMEILFEIMYKLPDAYMLMFVGGISYTLGAIFYMLKYPKLCPIYFGSHELMHLLSVIGTLSFTICIFFHAIPYHKSL